MATKRSLDLAEATPEGQTSLVDREDQFDTALGTPDEDAIDPGRDIPIKGKAKAVVPGVKKIKSNAYEPAGMKKFAAEHPDTYWSGYGSLPEGGIRKLVDGDVFLPIPKAKISAAGPITGMVLSPDGTLLTTFSNSGDARIWEIGGTWRLLQKLRDAQEENIDEFLVGKFTPNQEHLIVAGKLKDRKRWSNDDDDNHILPCPLKIFDVVNGTVITQLHGHQEEILCVKGIVYKGRNYWITTSQDGSIIKWEMEEDWITLVKSSPMQDNITCMAFMVSFLPNTGNRYFVAATDDTLKLYDFETGEVMKTFPDMYTSYCDCAKFIHAVDLPTPQGRKRFAYLMIRGVETLEDDVASKPNNCTLFRLTYPTTKAGDFSLEHVQTFQHDLYQSNSWLTRVSSNGTYLAAPTMVGTVCIFRLSDGALLHVLKGHDEREVRDIVWHPTKPYLFSSADDGRVIVYTVGKVEVTVEVSSVEEAILEDTTVEEVTVLEATIEEVTIEDPESENVDIGDVA